ncbi:MAG: serine hydrolase [Ignavibacteriaceae bacterium]|nr:serine hydrolase [Ignavibacteriaceae bacterium]
MRFLIFLAVPAVLLCSCTFTKVIWYNFSDIDDYKIFPYRELKASQKTFHFPENLEEDRIPAKYKNIPLDEVLVNNETIAFLVIKNDTLIYEKYFDEHTDSSISLSFSMAKSFLSILIGCAIDDGLIKSVEQPVTDFIPELKKNGFDNVKIKHLLQMTSGMDYKESDNPFGIHVKFYYGDNLEERLLNLELKEEPGKKFIYKSGENQLLGLILSRAIKPKTITAFMQEKLWEPLGMEYDGLYSLDNEKNGLEKTFCCMSAAAKDYAKFGRLFLNNGNWNGRQIISQNWVEQSTRIDTSEGSAWFYQYQWWLSTKESGAYLANGHLGQYVYVSPPNKLIIVRLGKSQGSLNYENWQELFAFLSNNIK